MTPDQKADFDAAGEFAKKAIGLAVLAAEEGTLSPRAACTGLVQAAVDLLAAQGHAPKVIAEWLRGLARCVEMQNGITRNVN